MWKLINVGAGFSVGAGLARDAGDSVFSETELMPSQASQLPH
jgi:hypothetical protein